MPKVELYVHGRGDAPLAREDPDIIAIATDAPVGELIDVHVPVFSRDEPDPIVDLVVEKLGLKRVQGAKGERLKERG
jgi:AmiR/NasT family two-component response regulator